MTDPAWAENSATYDRIVDDYEVQAGKVSPEFAAFRASFVTRLPERGQVLDLGCGPGRDAAHFMTLGLRVAALDASTGMVRRARQHGVPAAVGDHRRPPFGPAVADGVWSSATLLHVPRQDVPATLAAWRRLLRPHGVLGLSTSLGDTEGWEDVPYASDEPEVDRRRWFVHFRRDELLGLLTAAGFTILSAEERSSHRKWLQVLAEAEGDVVPTP